MTCCKASGVCEDSRVGPFSILAKEVLISVLHKEVGL